MTLNSRETRFQHIILSGELVDIFHVVISAIFGTACYVAYALNDISLSDCLSLTLVDCDRIGQQELEIGTT